MRFVSNSPDNSHQVADGSVREVNAGKLKASKMRDMKKSFLRLVICTVSKLIEVVINKFIIGLIASYTFTYTQYFKANCRKLEGTSHRAKINCYSRKFSLPLINFVYRKGFVLNPLLLPRTSKYCVRVLICQTLEHK